MVDRSFNSDTDRPYIHVEFILIVAPGRSLDCG
jgi:hypothetical protein